MSMENYILLIVGLVGALLFLILFVIGKVWEYIDKKRYSNPNYIKVNCRFCKVEMLVLIKESHWNNICYNCLHVDRHLAG